MCVALHFCEECHGLHEDFFFIAAAGVMWYSHSHRSVVDSMLIAMQGIVYLCMQVSLLI